MDPTEHEILLRYWYYKERLQHFVFPFYGSSMGECEMAGARNRMGNGILDLKNIDFGQHGIYFGYYLGLLATEYRLLMNNGKEGHAINTGVDVLFALTQFIEHMDKCEQYWNLPPEWNGFFIRNSVPLDFLNPNSANGQSIMGDIYVNYLNSGLTGENIYFPDNHSFINLPNGHPGWIEHSPDHDNVLGGLGIPESMSMDEAIGVLMGLALVMFHMQDYPVVMPTTNMTITETARECGKKIVQKLYSNGAWTLFDPGGSNIQYTGNFAYGIARVGWYFGMPLPEYWNFSIMGGYPVAYSEWYLLPQINTGQLFNEVMESTLAAIGNGWQDIGTQNGIFDDLSSFWIHTFYEILFDVLHFDIDYNQGLYDLMKQQLSVAPNEGPYNFGENFHPDEGWAYSYKWRGDLVEQYNGTTQGVFSGSDYMVAYNMYALGKELILTDYHPYNNLLITKDFPVVASNNEIYGGSTNPLDIIAYDEITSYSKIWNSTKYDYQENVINPPINEAGMVHYVAKNSIQLTSWGSEGFSVEKGADFTATIVNPIYWDNFSQNSPDPYNSPSIIVLSPSIINENIINNENINDPQYYNSDNIKDSSNQSNFVLFPNPTSLFFILKCDKPIVEKTFCYIFDLQSELNFSYEIKASLTEIQCDFLLPGMYIVKIQSATYTETLKLVKI